MYDIFEAEPRSAQDAYHRFSAKHDAMIASGRYQPVVYPLHTLGFGVVIIFLLLDYRKSHVLRRFRLPVWLVTVVSTWYNTTYVRGRSPAAALGVGVLSAWFTIWTGAVLVFDDCQTDYARVDKRRPNVPDRRADNLNVNGEVRKSGSEPNGNGSVASERGKRTTVSVPGKPGASPRSSEYYWQTYPSTFLSRVDWVLDVLTTFRGTGWTWRIGGLPPIPWNIEADLQFTSPYQRSPHARQPALLKSFSSRSAILRHNFFAFIRNYLVLDLIKTLMSHDAYFWGFPNTTRPPNYLPLSLRFLPFPVRICRIFICLGALKFGLDFIFRLGPLFFVGLLGPERISVRGEAWLSPDMFGPLSAVFDKGLGGWWGSFWHQTFRHGFEAPGNRLVKALGLQPRSNPARLAQLFVAFALSGVLHACGSITQIGDTRPIRGPITFFLSQAVGIALQMQFVSLVKRTGLLQKVPRRIRRWANFIYAHVWLYYTAWLQIDDFGRGGVWLFEPLPVSILRGPLGLGGEGETWWQWGGGLVHWHTGKHWWESGITA